MNDWRLYWGRGPLPSRAEPLGVVQLLDGQEGALLSMPSGYYIGIAGIFRRLPGPNAANAQKSNKATTEETT
jgi:hypothetical protein